MDGRERTLSHSFGLDRVRIMRPSRLCLAMQSHTVQKKIKVMEWHRRNGKNLHLTARQFKLDRKRIREWEKNCEVLLQQNFGKLKLRQKLRNGAPVFSKEVDDALFKFLERERSAGRAVGNKRLSEEALRNAIKLQLGKFVHIRQYLKRWKQRFNVFMRQATNDSQKVPEECADAAKAFRSPLGCLRSRHEYTLRNMANKVRRWFGLPRQPIERTILQAPAQFGLPTPDVPGRASQLLWELAPLATNYRRSSY
ncbi:hypothetical protein ISCGN_010065 [Ixodes scapularis]